MTQAKTTDLSKKQAQALRIIRDKSVVSPRHFARLFWPDSECWSNHTKCGPNGVSRGGGMSLAGGGYLGKLTKAGLIQWMPMRDGPSYFLTELGKRLLMEAETNA